MTRVAQRVADTVARAHEVDASMPYVVNVAAPVGDVAVPPRDRVVPDIRGLTLRRSVLMLHAAGFRVLIDRGDGGTMPGAGSMLREGTLVRLLVRP